MIKKIHEENWYVFENCYDVLLEKKQNEIIDEVNRINQILDLLMKVDWKMYIKGVDSK